MRPLVTIGIPFHAEPVEFFELAVRSVFAQTTQDWELLLFADGANDALRDAALAVTDPRVRVLEAREPLTLPVVLNAIAREARGDYIARMDADDLMSSDRLSKQVAYLEDHPEADAVVSRAWLIDEEGKPQGLYRQGRLPASRVETLRDAGIVHPTLLARRDWFLENPYAEHMTRAQDKELWLRTNLEGFAQLDEPLLYYRVSKNLSYTKHAVTARMDRRIIMSFRQSFPRSKVVMLLLRSYLRQCLFGLSLMIGGRQRIYRRKVESLLTPDPHTLKAVLATAVPGWSSFSLPQSDRL